MDEFQLIEKYFTSRGARRDDVRIGIGDDAAVTVLEGGYDLVVATDSICEGTHFPAGTDPRALGHRCLAVNLSDLAAMAAEPLWCTLALSLPATDEDWLQAFAEGFFDLARRFDVALIGGDTVRGPLAMTVTVHGRVKPGQQVTRSGAGPGQGIYVTGFPGEAGAGLKLLTGAATCAAESSRHLTHRFLYPEARVELGCRLGQFATAMIDMSDGLHVDLARLLDASDVGAELETERVPLSADLLACFTPAEAADLALTGGDDYELCFTAPDKHDAEIEDLAATAGESVTRIGRTCAEIGLRWTRDGRARSIPASSFRHFD
jgi:thiamine-monophosphate kinase